METPRPTPADILVAIGKAELGDWIDPSEAPINWECNLYSPEGYSYNGHADTPGMAMALAWLHAWAPDALINAHVEPGSVPFEVPDGWRFELTPVKEQTGRAGPYRPRSGMARAEPSQPSEAL
jgi:hypothetical protein